MKYFNPSYWFKLWVLSAPLFNSENQGINAKSINNNQKIKDWASKNTTSLESINQEISFINSSINYQPYNLNQVPNQNINPIYQAELETSNHKHRHEKSRRIKKQVTPHPRPSKEIFQLSEKLIINQNNPSEYRSSFQSVLESLTNNRILRIVFDDSENRNWGENSRIFSLNSQNYGYFRLPVQIIQEQNGQSNPIDLELVLSTDALYIQGFIINHRDTGAHTSNIETYYYFNPNLGTPSGRYNPQLTTIPDTNPIMLNHIGNAYRHLIPNENNNINWETIYNSFLRLTNNIDVNTEEPLGDLAKALGQVIFMTAEAMRFPDIYARIVTHLIRTNENLNLESNQGNEIYRILVSWGTNSRDSIFRWLLQIANTIQNTPNMMISPPSIVDFTRELNSPAVQVILGYIEFQRLRNNRRNANCRRGKREIKNTYWHEKFCDLKPQCDKINGEIKALHAVNSNLLYVGTTTGLYAIDNRIIFKNQDIIGVTRISSQGWKISVTDNNWNVWDIEENEHQNWRQKRYVDFSDMKTDKLFKTDIISQNINCDIDLYYDINKSEKTINYTWLSTNGESESHYYEIYHIFNLGYTSPFNYKKIKFLGNNFDKTGVSWQNDKKYANKFLNSFNGFNIASSNIDYIKNIDVRYLGQNSLDNMDNENAFILQEQTDWNGLKWSISLGLFAQEKHNSWKLQVFSSQYAYLDLSFGLFRHNGEIFTGIGKGIKLYNENCDNSNWRKKRDVFNINNVEEQNVTKWTDDFTKSINNEQHLPIDNKTKFVTNNITSL